MIIYVICWPLLAWQAGKLIPAIGEGKFTTVINVIAISIGIFLVQKICQFAQDTILAKPSLSISQKLRENLFGRLLKIELNSLDKLSSGDITYRLTEDADRVGEVIYKTIQDTFPCILQLIAVFGYMLYLDWKLSLATIILAPVVGLLVGQFGMRVMIAAEKSQIKVSKLASLLSETIQGLPLVRAFAAEKWIEKRFKKEVEEHREARYKTLRLLALQHPVVGFIEALGILTILAIGAARIQSGVLDSEQFSSYVAALLMLIDPISHLTTNFNEFQQGQASLKRLGGIEKENIETADILNPIVITKEQNNIQIKDLTFSYQGQKPTINKLSLEVKKGTVVALVGPSGAGKSTLFSLLLRFIKPESGAITIDGVNIQEISRFQLREQIALVPQKGYIFSGSVLEIIKFGRNKTKEEVINAAKLANAHEFIMNLESGYETHIEERGSNISGGQLQRLAIARAVLGDPSILLLDEATSALDAEAEESVQIGIKQAMHKRSVLVIAHRLSTVQEADVIFVIEKGKIIEAGNHYELIKRDGRYRDLCQRQLIRQIN